MKLDLEDFRNTILELDESIFFNKLNKRALTNYENQFGRLPSKVNDWEVYKEYISKFNLPFDFLIRKEVEEIIDKQILFQFLASSEVYKIQFEITDNDEIVVLYDLARYYGYGTVTGEYVSETGAKGSDDIGVKNLSEIEVSDIQSICLVLLFNHLNTEMELAEQCDSKEEVKEYKKKRIYHFKEKIVPMLKLQRKVHRVMKTVRTEVELAKNNLSL